MNLVQQLRRLRQQNSGWKDGFDSQSVQMALIVKLYAQNGLEIRGGGACPEQYEVFKDGQQVAYYRLRHGAFRVDYPEVGGKTILFEHPEGDGIFNIDERLKYLTKAMRQVLSELQSI